MFSHASHCYTCSYTLHIAIYVLTRFTLLYMFSLASHCYSCSHSLHIATHVLTRFTLLCDMFSHPWLLCNVFSLFTSPLSPVVNTAISFWHLGLRLVWPPDQWSPHWFVPTLTTGPILTGLATWPIVPTLIRFYPHYWTHPDWPQLKLFPTLNCQFHLWLLLSIVTGYNILILAGHCPYWSPFVLFRTLSDHCLVRPVARTVAYVY